MIRQPMYLEINNRIMPPSGMLRRVVLDRSDVSEERIPSIIMMTVGEQGTVLAVTSNRGTLRRNTKILYNNSGAPSH
jgi:hypothetical protein